MIGNYKGNVNRTVLRDFERLCSVNAENKKNVFDIFNEAGKVSVYTNLGFFGMPDELSDVVTLKTEDEVNEFLKKDFLSRIDQYLGYHPIDSNYLINGVLEFIKENGIYPDEETFEKIEKEAEEKRIASNPANDSNTSKEFTDKDIVKEILELAEEIIESKRKTNPKEISTHVEPYPDVYGIYSEDFNISIEYDRWYARKKPIDYSCKINLKDYTNIHHIALYYDYSDSPDFSIMDYGDRYIDIKVTNYLIDAHKFIVQIAKTEGIKFTSEIDYEKFDVQ